MKNKLVLIGIISIIIMISGCSPKCPETCDDANPCTADSCGEETEFECRNAPLNGKQPLCSADVTCGTKTCKDGACEIDYEEDCCGNNICEIGETYSSCNADCPNCDDNNKLTTDSFNYKTKKCENPLTHYFVEDFEEGKTSIEKGANWKIVDDQGDKVLDCTGKEINGVEDDWANFGNEDWANYESELNFKLVENYEGFGFHFFSKDEQGYIVDIRGGKISLKKESQQGRGEVSSKSFDFKLNEWYMLKTTKIGNNIKIYIDGTIVLEYTDNQPLDTGQLLIETFGEGHVRLDDISIKK